MPASRRPAIGGRQPGVDRGDQPRLAAGAGFSPSLAPSDERSSAALTPLPTQVRIDNSNSERFTIVDIFAADRMGLLYSITRTLFELG